MGKKYFDTKDTTLESSILSVWQEAAKKEELSTKQKKLDVDGDGEIEGSDLAKLRKKGAKKEGNAFGKALKDAKDKGEKTFVVAGKTYEVKEEVDEGLEDSPNPANSQHLCAKNVVHEEWGAGQPVHGMHDTPDADGNIAWYDVMFEHGIEKGVSINELKVTKSESHHHGEKKKDDEDKEMLKAKKHYGEEVELDEAEQVVTLPKGVGFYDTTNYPIGGKFDRVTDSKGLKVTVKRKFKLFKGTDTEGITSDGRKVAFQMRLAKKNVKEYYEIGTDEYRDHTLDVTPGQDDPEWVAARDFKVASMKEALAKVWGLDEKALDKSSKEEYDEEDEELKPVKGSKTMTGGKVAKVEIQPKIDG